MNKQTGNEIAIEQQLDDIFDAIQMLRSEVKVLTALISSAGVKDCLTTETNAKEPLLY